MLLVIYTDNLLPSTDDARIANVAAGIVVQKIGTATLSVEELNTNL